MGTPEGKVKQFIDKRMKEWFPDAVKYSPPGLGRFGKNGMPDRIWWIRASDYVCVTVAIEAKDADKNPTDLQYATLKKFYYAGAVTAVVRGKDLERMEAVRDEVLRRIRLANEGSK